MSSLTQGRLLARNAVLQALGQALPLAIGLLTIPVLVRVLGPARFGLLSLAWALIGYFTLFDIGLGRAVAKLVSEILVGGKTESIPTVAWTAIVAQAGLGAAAALVLAALSPVLVHHVLKVPAAMVREAEGSVYILAGSVPLYLIIGSLRAVLEAAQRFDLANLVRAPFLASYFLMPAVGVLLGWDLRGVVGLLVFSAAAALAGYLWLCLRLFPTRKGDLRWNGAHFRRLLAVGSWVSVTSVVTPVLVQLDRFVIGALVSMTAVAYYAAPYEMVTRLWIVPSSLSAPLFPAFSALSANADRQRLQHLLRRATKHVLMVLGPIVAVLIPLAHDVVRLLLGPEYVTQSTAIFRILALGVLVNALAFAPVAMLQATGRPDVPARFHLLEVVPYVLLLWLLVNGWGITGAAVAWTARVAVDTPLQLWAAGLFRSDTSTR